MSEPTPHHRRVVVTDGDGRDISLALTVVDGDPERTRPPIVFCHGFPELAHSWRHQLPAVAAAGFTAAAPDMRGYGSSDAPDEVSAYRVDRLCEDIVGVIDSLDAPQAVVVGHDWGGFVAWAMTVLHPERCAGVVGICTPYLPFPTTEFLRSIFTDDEDMYMLWFQEPGVAEPFLNERVRTVFTKLLRGGVDPASVAGGSGIGANPFLRIDDLGLHGAEIVSQAELDHYVEVYERTGFDGGINWYRVIDSSATAFPQIGTTPLDLPALMLCAEWDPALPPSLAERMPGLCSDLETHLIPGAGHWVQQEDPTSVNRLLLDWLRRRFG